VAVQRQQNDVVESDRREEPDTTKEQIRDEWSVSAHDASGSVLPWSLLGVTLGALGIVLYLNSTGGI